MLNKINRGTIRIIPVSQVFYVQVKQAKNISETTKHNSETYFKKLQERLIYKEQLTI